MDGLDVRLRRVTRWGIRARLIVVVWRLGVMPSALVLVNVALGPNSRPWFNGLGVGLAFTVLVRGEERRKCRYGFGARRRTAVEQFTVAVNRGWW